MDVSDKDLGKFPILMPDKIYRLEIRKPTVSPGKSDPNKQVARIPLYTTKEEQSSTGETINAGFPVYDYITVTPTADGKPSAKQIADRIGTLCQAAGVKGLKVSQVIADINVLDGKLVDAKVGKSKATDEFGESSRISRYIPAQ